MSVATESLQQSTIAQYCKLLRLPTVAGQCSPRSTDRLRPSRATNLPNRFDKASHRIASALIIVPPSSDLSPATPSRTHSHRPQVGCRPDMRLGAGRSGGPIGYVGQGEGSVLSVDVLKALDVTGVERQDEGLADLTGPWCRGVLGSWGKSGAGLTSAGCYDQDGSQNYANDHDPFHRSPSIRELPGARGALTCPGTLQGLLMHGVSHLMGGLK